VILERQPPAHSLEFNLTTKEIRRKNNNEQTNIKHGLFGVSRVIGPKRLCYANASTRTRKTSRSCETGSTCACFDWQGFDVEHTSQQRQ
jgi:hypothetical protein